MVRKQGRLNRINETSTYSTLFYGNSKYTMSISLHSGTTLEDMLHEETSRTRIVLIDESERLCSKEVSS